MNVNIPESQTKNQSKEGNIEPSLYDADKLINISSQAKILAWVALVISIAFLLVFLIGFIRNIFFSYGYESTIGFNDLVLYLLGLFPVLIGLFLYIILRFIAEGIFLLMDIEINFRELSERQK
jgi:hypothetical protein